MSRQDRETSTLERTGLAILIAWLSAIVCATSALAAPPAYNARPDQRQPSTAAASAPRASAPAGETSMRLARRPATEPPPVRDPAQPRLPQEIPPRTLAPQQAEGLAVPEVLPPPSRLFQLPSVPNELRDPQRNPQVEREYGRFVERTIDPETALDLIAGRPRILVFRQTPTRIYIAHEEVAGYDVISGTEIAVVGKAPGRTVLTIWVPDPDRPGQERVLSYLLRVSEDVDIRVRLEAVYEALEREINENFPNSWVKLALVGDKLVLRGESKDIFEATQILQVVNANVPRDRTVETVPVGRLDVNIDNLNNLPPGALEDFLRSGSNPNVVNLLHIPGERQCCCA